MIVAASPHRAEAFAACRYAIERVKQIAPIWKHEHFEGGDVWIEGATADPGDETARGGGDGTGVHVTVRLFARLRELAGAAELSRQLARRRDRAGRLARAAREFPAIADYATSVSCAVNETYARLTTELRDGDEVAFLPPVSGG